MLDLFCGAGGMSEGFLQSGFSIPYASDKSEQAELTYKNRHSQLGFETKFHCGDIAELSKPENLIKFLGDDINQIDVICGGPPCQGFSLAGKRNPSDLRNQLVHSYINILSQIKPKYFVMENVLGILSAKFLNYQGVNNISYINQMVIDVLLSEFKAIGYPDVQIKLMDASDYGVPQKRQRVIFLGTREDVASRVEHPQPYSANKISAKDAISDLAEIELGKIESEYSCKPKTEYQRASRIGRTMNRHQFYRH